VYARWIKEEESVLGRFMWNAPWRFIQNKPHAMHDWQTLKAKLPDKTKKDITERWTKILCCADNNGCEENKELFEDNDEKKGNKTRRKRTTARSTREGFVRGGGSRT
jgi:hypothetical protein